MYRRVAYEEDRVLLKRAWPFGDSEEWTPTPPPVPASTQEPSEPDNSSPAIECVCFGSVDNHF